MVTTEDSGLVASLFGKARRSVLAVLYTHPDEAFYLRQLVRASGAGVGPVQREVRGLTASGIISRTVRGKQVYYQANRECPIFEELKSLMVKTAGIADLLRSALVPLADRINLAFIYGSVARGEHKRASDIDLMVVGDVDFGEVVAALGPVQDKLNREVNPTVYGRAEFAAKAFAGKHFINRFLSGKLIFLIGSQDELAGMAKKRLAG
jgi:predicted nucleotidyltransferase